MSYILDALNKADQARKQQLETSPQLPSSDSSQAETRHNQLLPAGLLTLSLSGLLYWLAPWQAPQTPVAAVTQPTVQPVITAQPQTPTHTEPVQQVARKTALADEKPDIQPQAESRVEAVPALMDLPRQLLDALPAINISAHTYSAEKHKRMVIINNKVLHENRPVTEQLLLRSITKEGVELEFNGTLFSMTTYDSWPY